MFSTDLQGFVKAGIPSLEMWDDDGYFVETTLSSEELARIFRDAGLSISSVHLLSAMAKSWPWTHISTGSSNRVKRRVC